MLDNYLIATGNLGAPVRTIGGLLGQMESNGLTRAQCEEILISTGLPPKAYDEPDFPISLEQDWNILNSLFKSFRSQISPVTMAMRVLPETKATDFGLMGLAMMYAGTLEETIAIPLTYPEVNWGHSRLSVWTHGPDLKTVFMLEPVQLPGNTAEENEDLRRYALSLDLIATIFILQSIYGDALKIRKVKFPFPEPDDWHTLPPAPWRVQFDAEEAAFITLGDVRSIPSPSHSRLSYSVYLKLIKREAKLMSDDVTLSEQVTRWLWTYSPPLKKSEIANLLGRSERSLTRQLKEEGTSYNTLFAKVQAERAINLLQDRSLTMAEIGYRLGYSDPAAFSRAFTSWRKCSPTAYRKKMVTPEKDIQQKRA